MELRRIDAHTYDVFEGKGWDNHVRVRKGRSSTYRVSGGRVARPTLHFLDEVLAPNMPITYGQDINTMLNNINAIVSSR